MERAAAMSERGSLHLVPNTLDFGTAGAPAALDELLPTGVIRVAASLAHWVCENAKTTRAFLKRVDAVCPLARPLQEISIVELPRPNKGRDAPADPSGIAALLAPARAGHALGLLSEAGLPALADPGAALVAAAHAEGIAVVAHPGASSIALALAASGLNGQSFAFVGYVPVPAEARAARIRVLEATSRRQAQTQLLIETPYRNGALLEALLANLQPATVLSVSVGLTLPGGFTRSASVAGWRQRATPLPADVPAVFAFLAG
ncbi:MAG: SAM-dependent methyltransferase [Caldimonas sp.]